MLDELCSISYSLLDSLPRANFLIGSNFVAKKNTTSNNVTRIKASGDKQGIAATKPAKNIVPKKTSTTTKPKRRNPLTAMKDYFVGAWYELRQVRWPNRRATWSLTFAVIAFTTFFVVIILLLDAAFKYLFELL